MYTMRSNSLCRLGGDIFICFVIPREASALLMLWKPVAKATGKGVYVLPPSQQSCATSLAREASLASAPSRRELAT